MKIREEGHTCVGTGIVGCRPESKTEPEDQYPSHSGPIN